MIEKITPMKIFFLGCIGVLLWACISYPGSPTAPRVEMLLAPTLVLIGISFPSSLFVVGAYALISKIPEMNACFSKLTFKNELIDWFFWVWVPFCLVAYMQWFVILPKIVHDILPRLIRRICSYQK